MLFLDENLNTLSLKLQDKEEKIDLLNARVEELVETEDALKTTIDKADDMIAEREKQHVEQLEQLQDGLNRYCATFLIKKIVFAYSILS